MKSRVSNLWEQVRASFWFVPALMALSAAALSMVTLMIDGRPQLVGEDSGWFWSGEPQGARDMLTTIAGSMITVAGIAFSITIVALTLAANQFGPRLLRSFMRDTGNQVVLGTFVATFIYCLLVLRVVRGGDGASFVPHLSITVAVVLAIASIGVLVYFIHHVSVSLQVENLAAGIASELSEVIENMFPEKLGTSPSETGKEIFLVPDSVDDKVVVPAARRSGYLQAIENESLLAFAQQHDLVLCLHCAPGEFIREGGALLSAWPAERYRDELDADVAAMFVIGRHRTPTQDVNYPLQQLVSIAVRALSPGINDPFSAITCIDWIGNGLRQLAERRIPSRFRLDGNGCLRVIAPPLTFAEVAEVALNQIRQFGAGHVAVMLRLLEAIESNGQRAERPEDRAALIQHAHWILNEVKRAGHQSRDLETVERLYRKVIEALSGESTNQTEEAGTTPSERA